MSDKNVTKLDKDFDWGFSLLKATEIDDVLVAHKSIELARNEGSSNLSMLHDMIDNFLSSLEANPEKEYIHWPDRAKIVKAFRERITRFVTEKNGIDLIT